MVPGNVLLSQAPTHTIYSRGDDLAECIRQGWRQARRDLLENQLSTVGVGRRRQSNFIRKAALGYEQASGGRRRNQCAEARHVEVMKCEVTMQRVELTMQRDIFENTKEQTGPQMQRSNNGVAIRERLALCLHEDRPNRVFYAFRKKAPLKSALFQQSIKCPCVNPVTNQTPWC